MQNLPVSTALHPLTATGVFSLAHLHLNRPALMAWRRNKRQTAEQAKLVMTYRELVETITRLAIQQTSIIEEQQQILQKQQDLLREVTGNKP